MLKWNQLRPIQHLYLQSIESTNDFKSEFMWIVCNSKKWIFIQVHSLIFQRYEFCDSNRNWIGVLDAEMYKHLNFDFRCNEI